MEKEEEQTGSGRKTEVEDGTGKQKVGLWKGGQKGTRKTREVNGRGSNKKTT